MVNSLLKRLGVRRVYCIAFPCDQTMMYWTGAYGGDAAYTFLGREAWRTTDRGEADTWIQWAERYDNTGFVTNVCWEWQLNREDWTW